jgi:hypothetical protein
MDFLSSSTLPIQGLQLLCYLLRLRTWMGLAGMHVQECFMEIQWRWDAFSYHVHNSQMTGPQPWQKFWNTDGQLLQQMAKYCPFNERLQNKAYSCCLIHFVYFFPQRFCWWLWHPEPYRENNYLIWLIKIWLVNYLSFSAGHLRLQDLISVFELVKYHPIILYPVTTAHWLHPSTPISGPPTMELPTRSWTREWDWRRYWATCTLVQTTKERYPHLFAYSSY